MTHLSHHETGLDDTTTPRPKNARTARPGLAAGRDGRTAQPYRRGSPLGEDRRMRGANEPTVIGMNAMALFAFIGSPTGCRRRRSTWTQGWVMFWAMSSAGRPGRIRDTPPVDDAAHVTWCRRAESPGRRCPAARAVSVRSSIPAGENVCTSAVPSSLHTSCPADRERDAVGLACSSAGSPGRTSWHCRRA